MCIAESQKKGSNSKEEDWALPLEVFLLCDPYIQSMHTIYFWIFYNLYKF